MKGLPVFKLLSTFLAVALLAPLSARGEDAPAPPPKWYDTFEIHGLVDTYYSATFGQAQSDANLLRTFDGANGFQLSYTKLTAQLAPTTAYTAGFRADLGFGPAAKVLSLGKDGGTGPVTDVNGNEIGTATVSGGDGVTTFYVQQAYVSLKLPADIVLDAGKFVTNTGAEVIEAKDNWLYSRSILFGFAIPFTHTGVRGKYVFTDMIDLTLGINTGWDNPRDNNNQPSYEGRLGFTFSDKYSLVVGWMAGPEWLFGDHRNNKPRDRIGRNRALLDVVAIAKPTSQLTFILNYDYGTEDQVPVGDGRRDTHWNGLAAYAIYGWTDRFSTAVRGDYISDSTGSRVLHGRLWGLTLTPAYKFTEKLIGRAEYRHEWSSRNFFSKGRTATDKDQGIFALQATYAF